MPTCKTCGYWDDTDAEFDDSRTICDGCIEKAIQAMRERGALEWTCGKYTVLSLSTSESCDDCGSSREEFVAWVAGEFYKDEVCVGCDGVSIVDYLYPNADEKPLLIV
ncbi:hypothetical protein ACFQZE_23770 [Paenibacillus sp. GCM10027627]|uniref:hypothetical protein n=1 Tax=unclassified Paenibacillus TaxID=185978 RepID=UPI003626B6F9